MFPVVPHPQEIFLSDQDSYFILDRKSQIIVQGSSYIHDSIDLSILINFLNDHDYKKINVVSGKQFLDSGNTIFIYETLLNNPILKRFSFLNEIKFTKNYPGLEGYLLHITPKSILIAGHDIRGRYYAIQTLMQLIRKDEKSGDIKLPVLTIIDYPDMSLRSVFYGFYLRSMEDDVLIRRAYADFRKISRYKINMIDLASHHYGHLNMEVPDFPKEKLWQRYAKLHQRAGQYHLQPGVGGWAKWVNTHSSWGADLSTLECIRTSHVVALEDTDTYPFRISTGQISANVIYDFESKKSWDKEPVVVSDEKGVFFYKEGTDYILKFGKIHSREYNYYREGANPYLQVLFNKVHFGEGEPFGFPLRWGETFNSPTTIRRTNSSRISDGQKVKITFSYIGPDPWSLPKVRYCRSDERLHIDGPENYIWRWCTDPIRYWGADDFSLDMDETRVFAWDKRCIDSGKTRSRIWADDIKYYYDTIRKANPKARISMWSDMLDPSHNAKIYHTEEVATIFSEYDMTDIVMIPWKSKAADSSVQFFARGDFPLMPACSKGGESGYSTSPIWAHFLRNYYRSKDIPIGLMYCRWGYGFDLDETWEQLATVADHAWSIAPYILHTPLKMVPSGEDVQITARFEGDRYVYDGIKVVPGPLPLKHAYLYYRTHDDSSFHRMEMFEVENEYSAVIPILEVEGSSIEYYITMSDKYNTTYCPNQRANRRFMVKIE